MIKISLNIKEEKFDWITYKEFKKIEKEIIAIDTDIIDHNTLEDLIQSINDINLNSNNDSFDINIENKKENRIDNEDNICNNIIDIKDSLEDSDIEMIFNNEKNDDDLSDDDNNNNEFNIEFLLED